MFGVLKMIAEKTDGGDIVPSADNLHDAEGITLELLLHLVIL